MNFSTNTKNPTSVTRGESITSIRFTEPLDYNYRHDKPPSLQHCPLLCNESIGLGFRTPWPVDWVQEPVVSWHVQRVTCVTRTYHRVSEVSLHDGWWVWWRWKPWHIVVANMTHDIHHHNNCHSGLFVVIYRVTDIFTVGERIRLVRKHGNQM
jgi:hypothetical protein